MQIPLWDLSVASLLIYLSLILLCVYLWSYTNHYWKVRGVPYLTPVLPVFGNMYDIIFLNSLVDIAHRIYKETKGLPFVGIYAFHTPVLFVRDMDVMSNMLVKDFNHFEDRGFKFNSSDSLGRNLIHQYGADWKFSRAKLAPCFSINKVKSMIPAMIEKSETLVDKLDSDQKQNKVIETWDTALRYTTDVVTLCTLGIDANSLLNEKEEFRENGGHMLGPYFIYHVFIGCFFPWLHRFLGISVCKARVKKFFIEVVNQTINYRKNSGIEKKDFLNTLLQLKEETIADTSIPVIDNNFIAAQSFVFFLGGFESPGNILACTIYEVAKHPPIQEALRTEISHVLKEHGGEVTFQALQDMKYMKQVISEALRMHTPLTLIFRRCTKDYTIPGTTTQIEKGTLILIPLRSIHMDPDYYPDPGTFDPDRFSDDNSATRHIAAFMPFGIGPRYCPAVLYSYIKIKTALVHILSQYEVCFTKNTPSNLEPSASEFLFAPKNGIPLEFRRR